MKSATVCSAGTLLITVSVTLTRSAFSLITIRNGSRTHAGQVSEGLRREAAVSERGAVLPRTTSTGTKLRTSSTAAAANILIRVYNSLPDESIDYESDVTVHCDGRTYTVPAGTQVAPDAGREHPYPAVHVSRFRGRAGYGRCSAGRGQPVQRRQHGQPLQPAQWAASRRLRRTKRRTVCSATSIQPRRTDPDCDPGVRVNCTPGSGQGKDP